MRRALVVLLFLLSGAAALAYQVAWTRHLVLVFGNTTRAVALILAAYMLGLALGSEFGGRLADRSKRPVAWYAGFEVAIGVFALLFPWLVGLVRGAYIAMGTGATPVLFVGAFVILLVPTFLMGTTLPLLVRASVDDPDRTGGVVGLLYGANIVGAVIGTAFTGFWLIEHAGVLGSTRWAAATNVLIGLLALLVPLLPAHVAAKTEAKHAREFEGDPARTAKAMLLAAFVGGLVGLAAEVVWMRLLVFFLQGFTYTFSAMLAVFLLGLSLGGFVFGWVADRARRPAVIAGRLQLLVGVLSGVVLLALADHHDGTRIIWTWVGDTFGIQSLRVRHVATLLVASAVVLTPPAFVMGGVFPLACAAYQRGLDDLGARVGRLYAVNTIGAVLGSLLAGFVLGPLVGPNWAAAVVALTAIVGGGAVLLVAGERRGSAALWIGGTAVASVALLYVADVGKPILLRSHVFQGSRAQENTLLETRHGLVCQVSVVRNERDDYHLLYTDEFQAAGTKPGYRYMRMLAHLPVALADDPSRVLVICWGTGTTCGSVSTHPSVERLDIVEISPEVIEVAKYFEDVNKGVLTRDDLDVEVHIDDGRNFVLRSDEQWGVISLEPLMPYTPAAIHFYTEDFYRECLPRLAPGGTMCQWIPIQGLSTEHLRQLVSAFVNAFPGAALFHVEGAVALIGGHEPITLDHAAVAARLAPEGVRADLAAIGYGDPVRALSTFVASGEKLAEFGDVPAMTDEHPWLEFHPIPLNVHVRYLEENFAAMLDLRSSYSELPIDAGGDPDLMDRYAIAHRVGDLVLEGQLRLEQAGLFRRLGLNEDVVLSMRDARRAFTLAIALDPDDPAARRAADSMEREWATIEALNHLKANDLQLAERSLLRALRHASDLQRDVVPTLLAETYNRGERHAEALHFAAEATRLFPRSTHALAERAYARAALGDLAGATADYARIRLASDVGDLPPRLAGDAERFWRRPHGEATQTVAQQMDSALRGESIGDVTPALRMRILAADASDDFAAHMASDVRAFNDASGPEADRMLALKRLELAAPDGLADDVRRVALRDGDPPGLRAAAVRTLAALEPSGLSDLLSAEVAPTVLAAAARSAGATGLRLYGAPLLDRLLHPDADVREAAHRALFRLTNGEIPDLGSLDTSAWPSDDYRKTVDRIRLGWRRLAE